MLVALCAVALLALALRWTYGANRGAKPLPRADYGLLVEVASARTQDQAEHIRETLLAAGIRSTLAPSGLGSQDGIRILAFGTDASRARELLSTTS